MPGVVHVLNQAASLDTSPEFEPYKGVKLWYDDEHAFFRGVVTDPETGRTKSYTDETEFYNNGGKGRILEADCPWATQAIVNSVFVSVLDFVYRPFTAQSALLDPAAELGDGVSVGETYGMLAEITTTFDAACAADISAPSEEEIDHEYPYLTKQQREMNRKVTLGADYYGTRITRKNGLEVIKTGDDGTEKARVVLNSKELAFYGTDNELALYFDAEAGKYRFHGDVNITGGTMNINNNFVVDANGNLTLNGTITFGTNEYNNFQSAVQAVQKDSTGLTNLTSYGITRTSIGTACIESPEIVGNEISVYGTFQTLSPEGVATGFMGAANGQDPQGNTTKGVLLTDSWNYDTSTTGSNYVIVTDGGVRMQAGTNRIVVTNSSVNITTENGKAFYNGVEIGSGSGGTPVWG